MNNGVIIGLVLTVGVFVWLNWHIRRNPTPTPLPAPITSEELARLPIEAQSRFIQADVTVRKYFAVLANASITNAIRPGADLPASRGEIKASLILMQVYWHRKLGPNPELGKAITEAYMSLAYFRATLDDFAQEWRGSSKDREATLKAAQLVNQAFDPSALTLADAMKEAARLKEEFHAEIRDIAKG